MAKLKKIPKAPKKPKQSAGVAALDNYLHRYNDWVAKKTAIEVENKRVQALAKRVASLPTSGKVSKLSGVR